MLMYLYAIIRIEFRTNVEQFFGSTARVASSTISHRWLSTGQDRRKKQSLLHLDVSVSIRIT